MGRAVLALNAGSSSLKFGLFASADQGRDPRPLATGVIREEDGHAIFRPVNDRGGTLAEEQWETSGGPVAERLLGWAEHYLGGSRLAAAGHRIVHGGPAFSDPVEVDEKLLAALGALEPLAPLHQAAGLAPVRSIRAIRPQLRQFACFDTAFHRTIRPPAGRYALPRALEAQGIRRYGFHGLSYESIAEQLRNSGDAAAAAPDSRIIVAHLGNGASLCAMRGLQSVDTTMGFSTLDGLVMGTRPGSVDPGILLYLLKEKGFSGERLEQLLYRESGLLGVSGISPDVAALLKSAAPEAREALDLFTFQAVRHIAALVATLGGIDRIIFTGGIGEHSPEIVRMIVSRLGWLGASLDVAANETGATPISSGSSSVLLERRRTEEELMIARHVVGCLTPA